MTALIMRRCALGAVLAGAAAVTLAAGCGSSGGSSRGGSASGPVTVPVFEVAQADVVTQLESAFKKEMTAKLAPRKVIFKVSNANGDSSLIQSIARDLSRSHPTLIAVIGTPAVIAMAQQDKRDPIIALAMGDPVGSKVATSLDHPGGNVTGTIDFIDPAKLVDQLEEVRPAPAKIGTIYDASNENSQVWVKQLRASVAKRPGVRLVEATVAGTGDVQNAARSLLGRADTILIGPDATAAAAISTIGAVALPRGIPVYLTSGDASVRGVLATLGPNYAALGAAAADLGVKVVDGTSPAVIPFGQPGALTWDVNSVTLSKLKVTLPSDVAH